MNAPLRSTDLAREEIHQDLMTTGWWPTYPQHVRIQIEVSDYFDALPIHEQTEMFTMLWNEPFGDADDPREKVKGWHSDRIKAWIPERIVLERAAELAEQAAEDAETEREYQRMYPEVV